MFWAKTKKATAATLLSLLVLSAACFSAFGAQATAEISGTVRDSSGAVLPGVEVTVTQTETGLTRTVVSNETGSYVAANLPIGPYRLEAALFGFRTYVRTGIVLEVGARAVLNAVLEVGQVTETIEVKADAALVETRNVGVGQIMENARILELPLNGRQVAELVTLAGSAVQSGNAAALTFDGGKFISVGGGLGYGVAYTLDGATHNEPYSGLSLPFPFPDALQEFKVETSGLSAQNGGQAGAQVHSVTRSGTNDFHGSVFEFARNDLFNARSYFSSKESSLKRHQFGGTLGGPVVRNNLFFFGGYQGTTTRSDPSDSRTFVPTPAMLAGDFTAIASPACNGGRQITLRAPFANNRINPDQFSVPALAIVKRLPQAQNECGEVTYGNRNVRDDYQAVGKVDYRQSEKHSIFGRYLYTGYDVVNPYEFSKNLVNSNQRGFDSGAHTVAVGSTYLINPNAVHSLRLSASRTDHRRLAADIGFSAASLGIKTFSHMDDYMLVQITGAFSVGTPTATDVRTKSVNFQVADDLNIVKGTHQMSFGGDVQRGVGNAMSNVYSPGYFQFNGQQTGLGMADFLTGRLFRYRQAGPATMVTHRWYAGMYAQDTWRVTPKLTLNYGVRWEPYFPQVFDDGKIYNFDLDRFRQGIKSTVFKNAPAGFYYPGDPSFPGTTGNYNEWLMLGPRAGLAWDLAGDGRTSLRASYALAYNFKPLTYHIDTGSMASPWAGETIVSAPAGGFADPWRDVSGGNPFPVVLKADARFVSFGAYNSTPYDIGHTNTSSWNLSLQREFAAGWLASASYMGAQTVHLWLLKALNPGVYIPGQSTTANLNQRRALYLENPAEAQFIGLLDKYDDGGTQSYHGLLLNVRSRTAQGITVNGNYTWSHCIGDATDFNGAGPNPGTGYVDPANRRLDRGNCPSDRRHVVNLTGVFETPEFANRGWRAAGSEWRLSTIFRAATGPYLTVNSGVDQAMSGIDAQRADLVLANPYGDRSGRANAAFLNPAAFARPALGKNGNAGVRAIEGLGTWSFDVALSRAFEVRESQRLEFRMEAYNVTNSFRPVNPSTNLSANTFGLIRDSLDPRILQFALKYIF